jgi:hypothetical protein
MGEPAPPARVTGIYPGGATSGDHVRVAVRCSCGHLTDLTHKAGLPPDALDCAGCGERLELPGDLEPLTPKRIRCAEFRRSLRGGTDG